MRVTAICNLKGVVGKSITAINLKTLAEGDSYIVLGGYSASGKTAYALRLLWKWSASKKVVLFSLEAAPNVLIERMISNITGIPATNIKYGELNDRQREQLAACSAKLTKRSFRLVSAIGGTAEQIQRAAITERADIVVIDEAQLLCAQQNSLHNQITRISIDLDAMAQRTGAIVIALVSMPKSKNKDEEGRRL